jgi:hypothetical protein
LGHKSSRASDIYTRLNIDPVREAVEKATKVFEGTRKEDVPTPSTDLHGRRDGAH